MSIPNDESLDVVLGPGPGDTPEERAHRSTRLYVRSLDQLALSTSKAKGRELTAAEALDAYGFDVLHEVAFEGSALLSAGPRAAGSLLRQRRDLLGLDTRQVARSAKVDQRVIDEVEAYARVSIRAVERIARALGLDERLVSWKAEAPPDNDRVAIRLRTIGQDRGFLTSAAVAAIADAAWVAGTQARLQRQLGLGPSLHGITPSQNYGGPGYPPFLHGRFLAEDARKKLSLGSGRLPISLRELSEERLGIPVIQSELSTSGVAGVTVEIGSDRAIVINLDGENRSVFVRRATVAHELGHLLYDPPARLESLRVDEYSELDRAPQELTDPVEQRANAFAVEFIAPQDAVVEHYRAAGSDGVWNVMNHFGISYTAARYQIWNGLRQQVPLETIRAGPEKRPADEWNAAENYTIDYHPLRGIRPSRAGRFSAVVVLAAEKRLISWDSAAEMLEAGTDALQEAVPSIKGLFPTVFR